MKRVLLTTLLFCFFGNYGFPQSSFLRTFGSELQDYGSQSVLTPDGNIVSIGSYSNSSSVYLIKIDPDGNCLWQKSIAVQGSPDLIYTPTFVQTSDSGFIIAANLIMFGSGGKAICLLKTDSNGNLQWTKFFGGTVVANAVAKNIVITSDSGFAIVGSEGPSSARNVYVIKTNSIGDLQWAKSYGGSKNDEGNSIQQTSDGGYVIGGYTFSYGEGGWDVYLIKLSSTGLLQWTKTYGGDRHDYANDISLSNDGGFFLTGSTSGFGTGTIYDKDLFLMKTDSSGNIIWSYTYGADERELGARIFESADGSIFAIGSTSSFGEGQNDIFLLKTNAIGGIVYAASYGGSSTDDGLDLDTIAGGFLITGTTRNFSRGLNDVFIIRTDSIGTISCHGNSINPIRTTLPWVISSGGTENSGFTVVSNNIEISALDTTGYFPCFCVPPISDFQSWFTHLSGYFTDYSTWADTWFWDFGDGDTSSLQNPMHTFPQGYFNVCLTVSNACGTHTFCDSIGAAVGIDDMISEEDQLSIFPNPSKGKFSIQFKGKSGINNLSIYNSVGKSVYNHNIEGVTHQEIIYEIKPDLPVGIYTLILSSGKSRQVKKLIIQ